MKKFTAFLLLFSVVFSSAIVAGGQQSSEDAPMDDVLKIVLILNGTLGDKSFFDSADNGMKLIKDKYGDKVLVKTIEMNYDETKWEPTLLDVAEQDWDIVIMGTWQMTEMLQEAAPDYPDKKFIIFDTEVDYSLPDMDNIYSITYKQNEASFLAGALAARVTTSDMPLANPEKMIGFLGGMDIPVINDFLIGYIEGAQYIDKDIKVAVSYIGSFDDSAKGKEMSLAQYSQGADIGYNVAGQAGLGQLDAAKDADRYAIGVDSDQAELFLSTDPAKAELITTSVLKRVDNSLLRAIDLHMAGKAPWGSSEILGFEEEAVGFAENDIYMKVVPAEIREEMDMLQKKIIDGDIVVSSAFGMSSSEIQALRDSVSP
ncbi:BMP family ABC transporter substrate-binding protein [Spirochaeta isovalerica]|uniref:Basic membrane protein A n=1 Tax=Spirochaeta isovalerica TaxID=150 RepID=A0A841R6Q5_9SPIO|nr:BMP family ABC transporter substrate-binding protein [Spirochaeta isovalerica]MBB6478877.1 basic membrane protein A [Spirochaeta isovalerica]